jgi:uncharacterized damage-inducible protein DinB
MTRSLLSDAFAHHVWATEQLLDTCAALTPTQLQTNVPGTYGSIIATLRHLVASDRGYLRRFPPGAALAAIDDEDELSVAELRAAMAVNAPGWARLLETGIDPDLDIVSRNDEFEFHNPAGVRLAQVIHHGTDHRSQVCTALTTLGVTPPDIDVWAFAEAAGRSRTVPVQRP